MLPRGAVVVLLAALAALAACTPVRAPAVAYACEGAVRFERDHALVALPGGDGARLAQQASASGFLYAGAGYHLRGKGKAAQWTVGEAAPLSCLVVGP
ncbi:hypothetical protein ASF44_29930 [Pseudorhodoferax sp. Leaf274]|nr:hypothetical protein ASF44_29930 [Pseudorhodoferax sp. Leaf274]